MRYANILTNAISQSGLTYSQISMKCEQKGKKISRPYLSMLCTGQKTPASDETNKILSEVLSPLSDLSYEELTIAKYKETMSQETFDIIYRQGDRTCEKLKTF